MNNENENIDEEPQQEEWGHGEHWKAIFLRWDEKYSAAFLSQLYQNAQSAKASVMPWPQQEYASMFRMGYYTSGCEFVLLVGMLPEQKVMHMLSSYPMFAGENVWQLKPTQLTSEYGLYEGCVSFELPWEAPLKCFCPLFGEESTQWKSATSEVAVKISALAMELKHYPAEPIRVDRGPLLEMERQSLRDEGKHAEADALDHIMVGTDALRMLAGGATDHASLVGKIVGLKKLEATDLMPSGYQLEVEALPDYGQDWRNITVFAYLPSLGAYVPKEGDLVQGILWLQARLVK